MRWSGVFALGIGLIGAICYMAFDSEAFSLSTFFGGLVLASLPFGLDCLQEALREKARQMRKGSSDNSREG